MQLLRAMYYFFAPYTGPSERAVGVFFRGLTEHSPAHSTRARLSELLQQDIAVINLWSEYRYKGYKYLGKRERKKLYANLQLIADSFESYRGAYSKDPEEVMLKIHGIAPGAKLKPEQATTLQALMDYLAPSRGVYEYRESSSFGRLLRNPASERLVGDCNQIVTLYVYLYSQYHSVQDLQIRLLPGHVALHYGGVDIETTNGTLANYDDTDGQQLMPIEEIVSVNLLDTTDSYLDTHEVAPEDFLQSARFAFILSHDRKIVESNLDAAYGRLINQLMKRHNYQKALKLALASRDMELLAAVGNNGALHHMARHEFAAARRYAKHAIKQTELIRDSYRAEGAYHYDAGRYQEAIKAFRHYGDQELVQKCYEGLFFSEQDKLGKNITTANIKSQAPTIKRMANYAQKSGNKQLIAHASSLKKHLN